ncbi:MAG: hypothetical protein OIN90_05455 [Candidatus Methanoperedens sp.]|nr:MULTISPECIES: hypothetical protein [Methanoperedens]MCX9080019.1 hypothetical protein [Candidatus Methanoperedens sp.]MCX9086991.1 hypothetical protein [Candidatus Methanoperedens sp.]
MPRDRLVFTNIKIVSGFGAKGANFVERTKLTHATMRIIINVTKCLLSKTIPYVVLKISSNATWRKAIGIPVKISTVMLNQAKITKRFNTAVPSTGR